MKGFTFHEEYESNTLKRRRMGTGNVVAVMKDGWNGRTIDAIGGIFDYANSPVGTCGISPDILRTRTRRISEERARKIHPNLFRYLDQD